MPYIEEVCVCGRVREVTKRYSSRYGRRGIPRGINKSPTPEKMQVVNERNATTNLRRLINNNFKENDMHLVLTYIKGTRPPPEVAREHIEKFIRQLRNRQKKLGNPLKYIQTTEYKNSAIHHHLVINVSDIVLLQSLWPHGKARPTLLDNTGQYKALAEYLIKETRETFRQGGGRRYNSSKNLIIPEPVKRIVKANKWKEDPKPKKGYILDSDSIKTGVHEVSGYAYQFYSMIQIAKRE